MRMHNKKEDSGNLSENKLDSAENKEQSFENKFSRILNILNPIILVFFFTLFIIFTIVVLIINNKNEIQWYSNYYIFLIWIFISLLFLPYIFTLINGIMNYFSDKSSKQLMKKNLSTEDNNCPAEYLNTNFFWIIINGLKFCLLNSINTIITFLCVAAIYTLVENTNVIKNLMGFITFIIIFLILLFAYTMLFNIESSKQQILMALIILLVILKIVFEPLFWLLSRAIAWGKTSKNTFITIILLIIFSIVVFAINFITFRLNKVKPRINQWISDTEKSITQWGTGDIAHIMNEIANKILSILSVVKNVIPQATCPESQSSNENQNISSLEKKNSSSKRINSKKLKI